MIDRPTYHTLRLLQSSEERQRLDMIKDLIRFDLLTCHPISWKQNTRHVLLVGGPTLPIPIEEQVTGRMDSEVLSPDPTHKCGGLHLALNRETD